MSGTMNMTAYESRRPTMRVVTWWLTERDNQGLGNAGKTVRWNNDYIRFAALLCGNRANYLIASTTQNAPWRASRSARRLSLSTQSEIGRWLRGISESSPRAPVV